MACLIVLTFAISFLKMVMDPLVSAFQMPTVAEPTRNFIFWNEVFVHPYTFEVWGHAPATRSFCLLFKDGLSSPVNCQRVFNQLAAKVNSDRYLFFNVS
jgi:hypothetical protein